MEQEQSAHGHNFTFGEFLYNLEKRGKGDKAKEYEQKFMETLSPLLTVMTKQQIFDKPFKTVCDAVTLLNTMPLFSHKEAWLLPQNLKQGQTRQNSDFRYGTWYLKKMGEWPLKQEP